ncbi:MAG TPA: undecaprenyl-diphosphate phosphatase [Hymenobacter sp.]|nr:undecaprenyl-diphosphate phosphatase [Hymenobacter sp.]
MNYWQALLLAIVEGLTEFLPVSSTGHMIIVANLLGIGQLPFTETFITSIQLGAILSVVVLYWRRFLQSFDLYRKLAVAFIPFGILGFLLKDVIADLLKSVTVVATSLVVGGVVLVFIDRIFNKPGKQVSTPSYANALKVGLFQCFALIPGVSRSAATIIGGMFQGLTRRQAAEFSFFLAVPTMAAASGYKLLKTYKLLQPADYQTLLIGNAIAFVVGLMAIRAFVGFLTKYGFKYFGYYRIALGLLLLGLMAAGVKLDVL